MLQKIQEKLFPVKFCQAFVNPNGCKRKECCQNCEHEIFIIPRENLPNRKKKQKIGNKEKAMKIPDNNHEN